MRYVMTNPSLKVAVALLTVAPFFAAADDEGAGISGQVMELKKGQEAILKELAEIKKLLADRPAGPARPLAVQQIDVFVPLGGVTPKGDEAAPLTLIEFSDYQCPFCKRHAEQTLPQLLAEYVDSGKLRYSFRDFPLESIHPKAAKAAEAARCAGDQLKYWEMHDMLFANQRALDPQDFINHADAIGLDGVAFKKCLDQGKYTAAVKKDLEDGGKLGIWGTPTVVLGASAGDGVKSLVIIRGAQPFATFKAEIDKLLARATGEKR